MKKRPTGGRNASFLRRCQLANVVERASYHVGEGLTLWLANKKLRYSPLCLSRNTGSRKDFPMSTDPRPTRKADGSSDASVDEIAELLVEDESAAREAHPQVDQALDDSLDVMLETPGPAAVGTFMPPPPLLPNATDDNSSETEDRENAEEGVGQSNLAYEDLLAKLVLPSDHNADPEAGPSAPEPSLPTIEPLPAAPAPAPEAVAAPAVPTPIPLPVFTPAPTPAPAIYDRPSSSVSLAASATDERTLVTENPLLAEEQEAAAREGRSTSRDPVPRVQESFGSMASGPAPLMAAASATRTKMIFFIAGNLAMLLCMVVAVLVFKIFIQTPAPPPAVIMPAAIPLPPPPPPAKVEPLPSPPPAAAAPVAPAATPEPAAEPAAENPAAAEPSAEVEAAKPMPKAHRPTVHNKPATHAAKAAPVAPVAKPAPAPKAAAAPVAKPAKAPAKKGKTGGYADPFDN
jgi:hypothetical protein